MSQAPGVPDEGLPDMSIDAADAVYTDVGAPSMPADPTFGTETGASGEAGASSEDAAGATERPGIIEAVADLLQYIVDWLRQEAGDIMHDKVVIPAQKLGLTLASGCAAALLAALGLGFIAVGVFMLLGQWLTYPGALLLIGGLLVLGAVIFTVIKMRSMQK